LSVSYIPDPILILGAGAMLVYLLARLVVRHNGVLAAATATVMAFGLVGQLFLHAGQMPGILGLGFLTENIFLLDAGAHLLSVVTLTLGFSVTIYSGRYLELDHRYEDYYSLLLLLVASILAMLAAADLFVLYLSATLASSASFVLVAFRRRTDTAIEAGYKYAILGGMGSELMLFGVALVFRSTGVLGMPFSPRPADFWGVLGTHLILVGLLIKGAIFPAHTWLPDAHGRAPSSISAILSGIIVQSYLYALVKVGLGVHMSPYWLGVALVVLAIATMTVGNALALRQRYGKRLLGYSSIANVGYMSAAFGVGLMVQRPEPIAAGLFLLVVHAASKSLAFLCKGAFHFYCDVTLVDDLEGMIGRTPLVVGGFVLALAGLAGVPLLGGFMAKFGLLTSMIRIVPVGPLVIGFVLINTLMSLGYYVPLIGRVLHTPQEPAGPIRVSAWMLAPMIWLGALVLLPGLIPEPLLDWTMAAAEGMLSWGRP
jgi:multicomponent Na+:H+ antiporter subunit D